jgi:large subunit ribosomal protein L15
MIHNLPSPKTTKKSKQVGRGIGSGKGGHTTGRGTKGQTSRSGYTKPRPGFEGGQNPLSKRLPTLKGISTQDRSRKFLTSKIKNVPIQLSLLEEFFEDGDIINLEVLQVKKLFKPLSHKKLNVKVLFDIEISKKLNFEGVMASKKAIEAIEKAGGSFK